MTNVVLALQDDFKLFLQALWSQLDLPSPTRAQYAIADYLQHGPKRLQIQAFRGVGKSWITGAFVLWTLFNDPEKKIMIISASKERADNMSIFLQKLIIETPWLSHLRPKSDDSRWSRISFDVNCSPHQAPSVKSVGITGQLTGSRADLMILDDIEVPGNSMTELMREKLLQLCTEAESILTPKDDSRIMFLGTPQTTFTVYRKLAERAYKPFVWPARYPRKVSQYEGLLAPQLVADLDDGAEAWNVTDPDRFADDDLIEREAAMGRSNFLLQFMLDTSLSDAEKFPLKMADLIVTSVNPTDAPDSIIWCSDPKNVLKELPTVGLPGDYFYSPMQLQGEWHPYQETICSVDPSGRGSDETAAAFISQRNGFLYLHKMCAYRDGYSDRTLLDILKYCKRYNVTKLVIETNFGDGIVAELFKKHLQQTKQGIDVEEVRANVRKEDRIIDSLEPVMNQHRLVVDKDVIDWDYKSNKDEAPEKRLLYMLFYQMSRMCREKGAVRHDDRIDALAQGVKYFTDCMSISAQEAVNQRKREDWNDMLRASIEDPQGLTNHLVLGLNAEQRQQARRNGQTPVPNWVQRR
ncbi:terminase large subunit [uncultured phage_MedDCM-OCT-S28-C3]|uniref:Terminase, large subunit n=1 Tax=uncultured phage_MedDCM-OCT-S28-C3 TaxID=2740802 RepID=A0A6S4PI33_9CAUD|nr:terminase large subunit [uncultured phage_MedDCM-OCT-S28-C3]BAQ94016.1 terminase large subunit [uncultured phage_MedDCM-OCT-S28-C3]